MHKIDGAGHVNGSWVAEDVPTSRPPTEITADIMNALQTEIVNVVEAAGITLNKLQNNQLLSALRAANLFQTQGVFDNSTKAATTAFVQRALGNMAAGVSSANAAITATAADLGKFYSLISATAQTVTLPLLSAVLDGATLTFHNTSDSIKTFVRQGTDVISPDGSSLTSVTLLQGEVICFSKESSAWRAYGTGALKYAVSFGSLLSANGYQKLPSGLIVQWGVAITSPSADVVVTLPIAFPTACRTVSLGAISGVAAPYIATLTGSLGASAFNLGCYTTAGARIGTSVGWIAIGH